MASLEFVHASLSILLRLNKQPASGGRRRRHLADVYLAANRYRPVINGRVGNKIFSSEDSLTSSDNWHVPFARDNWSGGQGDHVGRKRCLLPNNDTHDAK